jgi:hypothetical protein
MNNHNNRKKTTTTNTMATYYIIVIIISILTLMSNINVVQGSDDLLHVHIIPHSHCDPGWLDTFERYYQKDVSHILSGVLTQLWADRNRRFIWAEISFFKRWWITQNHENRERFKTLVQRGQLEFIGGGWVQNDEANPTLESVVNQVSEGHAFLLETFGVRPKIGWQIDPFGHSAMTPSLFALLGYDAMVINRIHFDTKRRFKATRHMEFLWDGAKISNNKELDLRIFTHVLHTHYSAPRGFDFENPGVSQVSGYNADGRARSFASMMRQRQRAYMTNHLLVPFGDDFKFKNAARQFSSMGHVIEALNRRTELKIHARYSTLSEYFSAVHNEATQKTIQFPLYQLDFMPYADNGDSYWTGYYTTRPTLKAETRNADATLRSADLLYVLGRHDTSFDPHKLVNFNFEDEFKNIRTLRENAALLLHHDAITGTSRQTVVRDYLQRLTTSQASIKKMSVKLVQGLLIKGQIAGLPKGLPSITSSEYRIRLIKGAAADDDNSNNDDDDDDDEMEIKPFHVKGKRGYPVIVQNPLGWRRQDVVKVLLSDDTNLHEAKGIVVLNDKGIPVKAQVSAELHNDNQNFHSFYSPTFTYVVHFKVDLPPLGLRTYYICQATRKQRLLNDVVATFVPIEMYLVTRESGLLETKAKGSNGGRLRGGNKNYDNANDAAFKRPTSFPEGDISIENDNVRVIFKKDAGMLKKVIKKNSKAAAASGGDVDKEIGVDQQYMYYTSSRSGAYIFRPHGEAHAMVGGSERYRVYTVCKGGPVIEILQLYDGPVRQTTKLLKVKGVLSKVVQLLTSTVANMNNEIVTRFTTDLTTNSKFYTDNSVDFRERTLKHGSISSNFYPMNTAGALKEGPKQITFLNRQPMGCASLKHGEKLSSFEIMLHRQLRMDDGRGLAQGVHDSSRTSAPIWILVDSPKKSDKTYKRLRHHLQHDKVIFQAAAGNDGGKTAPLKLNEYTKVYNGLYAPAGRLDDDVHILSIKARNAASDDILLRIQNFGNEIKPFKLTVDANANNGKGFLFNGAVSEIRSRTISANQPSNMVIKRLHYPTHGEAVDHSNVDVKEEHHDENQNTEEEGVFLSDAAMQKLEEDKGGTRRRRLQSGEKSHALAVPPYQIRSYFVEININGGATDDGPNVLVHDDGDSNKNKNNGDAIAAKHAPLAPPVPEEDVHKAMKEQTEKEIVSKLSKKQNNNEKKMKPQHAPLAPPQGKMDEEDDDDADIGPLSESNPLLDKIDTGHGWSQFEKQLEGKLINEVHVLEKTNMKSRSFLFFIASAGIICSLFIYLKCCNGKLNRRQRRRRKATPKRA